jgi:hypothetical protein
MSSSTATPRTSATTAASSSAARIPSAPDYGVSRALDGVHRAVGVHDLGSVDAQGVAGELGLERTGERLGRREVGVRQQHRELVAAQARDDVALAQPPRQQPRDVAQQLVAGVVAEGVVDRLEVVEVGDEHRALLAIALDAAELALDLAFERAAVVQPREVVVRGQAAQLGLEVLAVGDVRHLRDEVQRPALLVAHERDGQLRPHDRSVGVQVALLHLVARNAAVEHAADELEIGVQVVGVREVLEALLEQRLVAVAENCAQGGVHPQPRAIRRDEGHPDRRAVEGRAELRVGRPARGLREPARFAVTALGLRAGALGGALGADVARERPLLRGDRHARAARGRDRRR